MSEAKRDYQIGYGKPPRGRPFQKGQSGNPRGPRRKDLSALLIAALNEPVYVTIDGKRRKITKREAIVTQMVNKSAKGAADIAAMPVAGGVALFGLPEVGRGQRRGSRDHGADRPAVSGSALL